MAEKQYRMYEDLVDVPRQGTVEYLDFIHGDMFELPDWVKWWAAKEVWGKPTKKDDPVKHTIDVRVCGFVMDGPEFWPREYRDRMGGLGFSFGFKHHKDPDRARHLCLKDYGMSCPRCGTFEDVQREENAKVDRNEKSRDDAWKVMREWKYYYSSLVFGYVNGDTTTLRAFEFSDRDPKKGKAQTPTFFDILTPLMKDKSIPAHSQLDNLFYSYGPRAQVIRLTFEWNTQKAGMEHWQLTGIYKVTEADGAPSTKVDSSVAERIKPWEWMDIKGERERMLAGIGVAKPAFVDFDKMEYAALMAFAMEKQMTPILEEGFEADETVALRAAIRKEVGK